MKITFQRRIPNENEPERAEEWHRGLSLSTLLLFLPWKHLSLLPMSP